MDIRRLNATRWLLDHASATRLRGFEQPSDELVERISVVHKKTGADVLAAEIPGLERMDAVFVNDVPHFPYWQGNANEYVFHPMSYGRLLTQLDCSAGAERYLKGLVSTAHQLSDGGLLWYYPNVYKLSRFTGPNLLPSAIGQGQILGGVVSLTKRCGTDLHDLARRIFKGLAYPYYNGGLNLEGRALLEIPLFHSAPEIVLNGWIHSLFFLKNYADHTGDRQARALLRSNYAFLADTISDFHDERTGLSLYSDMVPYQVRLEPGTDHLQILYLPRKKHKGKLRPLLFDLWPGSPPAGSPYDNHIVKTSASYTIAWVGCSQLYDTYLVSESGPFEASLQTGEYSPKRATPSRGGEQISFSSKKMGPLHAVDLCSARERLFCGFPTNFSKLGYENYYHSYHVVALACLLASAPEKDIDRQARLVLTRQLKDWLYAVDEMSSPELAFTPFERVLDELWLYGACNLDLSWEKLLRKVGVR